MPSLARCKRPFGNLESLIGRDAPRFIEQENTAELSLEAT
jgi:hypothetical protein